MSDDTTPAKKTAAKKTETKNQDQNDVSTPKLPSPSLAGGPSQDDLNPAYAPPKDDSKS